MLASEAAHGHAHLLEFDWHCWALVLPIALEYTIDTIDTIDIFS